MVGCASPAHQWWRHVAGAGLTPSIVAGHGFRHVVVDKPGRAPGILHVYVDGDGTPWQAGRPAADPTPRNPLVLELMRLDDNPSLYLGRPCYHGLDDPGCGAGLWTGERYSDRVVSSMAAALRTYVAARDVPRLAFIGYSGGGALAVLLASRFPQAAAVVTVAGNLDTDAWAAHHRYLRLTGSLNPAAHARLPASLYQRHYVGTRDRVVPREIVAGGAGDPSTVVVVPEFDHVCCWPRLWPAILADLVRATEPT